MGFLDKLLGRDVGREHPTADLANEAERRRAEGDPEGEGRGDPADRLEEGVADARTEGAIERRGDPFTS